MLRHKTLILAAVMLCLAIMALYSTNVLAQGIPEAIQRLKQIQQTLDDQIIPKLDQCNQCPECPSCPGAGVPKTGQTTAYGLHDDGDLEKGIEPPVPRFTDNSNGTVSDNFTGLVWLKNANCFGAITWPEALSNCNSLANGVCGLSDGSVGGNWRLPNLRELHSLVDYGASNPSLPSGHPFVAVKSGEEDGRYWTSTTYYAYPWAAWFVEFCHGHVMGAGYKDSSHQGTSYYYVWPVRDAH